VPAVPVVPLAPPAERLLSRVSPPADPLCPDWLCPDGVCPDWVRLWFWDWDFDCGSLDPLLPWVLDVEDDGSDLEGEAGLDGICCVDAHPATNSKAAISGWARATTNPEPVP
jgi:hypothetical protein